MWTAIKKRNVDDNCRLCPKAQILENGRVSLKKKHPRSMSISTTEQTACSVADISSGPSYMKDITAVDSGLSHIKSAWIIDCPQ